jgi:putative hemolysin
MNAKIKFLSIVSILTLFALSACTDRPPRPGAEKPEQDSSIANPATTNCELKGYRSQIRTTADGSQYGVCIFHDGSACEEWAFYRGQCGPTSEKPVTEPGSSQIANPASANCVEAGGEVDLRTSPDGSQVGVCSFPDGSECEEWAFFRGECSPGSSTAP